MSLDPAEGRRLLDELRWTQAYPDDDRTAAIDNAQLNRLIDLAHTLLSLAARTQQLEARIDVLEFALEGSEGELQQAEGLLQEADRFAVHRGNRCVESDDPARCDCGYAEWRDQVDAVLTKEPTDD